MKTSVICILDRSGSMSNMMKEVVGSFNSFIDTQRKIEGDVELSLYAFDERVETVFDKVDLHESKELTYEMVKPRGMTAMYDAIGKAILESSAEKAIVLIQTDGEENASSKFDGTAIKQMISIKESMGWEFHFIGAGIDAITAGKKFGMNAKRCVSIDGANGLRGAVGAAGDIGSYFSSSTALYRASANNAACVANVGANVDVKI